MGLKKIFIFLTFFEKIFIFGKKNQFYFHKYARLQNKGKKADPRTSGPQKLFDLNGFDFKRCKREHGLIFTKHLFFILKDVGLNHFLLRCDQGNGRGCAKRLVKTKHNAVILTLLYGLQNDAAITRNFKGRLQLLVTCANGCIVEIVSATNGIHRESALVRVERIAEVALALVASCIGMGTGLVQGNAHSATLARNAVFYVTQKRHTHALLGKVCPFVRTNLKLCNVALFAIVGVAQKIAKLCFALVGLCKEGGIMLGANEGMQIGRASCRERVSVNV